MLLEKENIKQKPLLKGGKAYFKISKIILIITLLICFMSITLKAEENNVQANEDLSKAIEIISEAEEIKNVVEELIPDVLIINKQNDTSDRTIFKLETIILSAKRINSITQEYSSNIEIINLKVEEIIEIINLNRKEIQWNKEVLKPIFEKIIFEAEEIISDRKTRVLAAGIGDCKDLKPFNNIDELLYQFYINLESDCLFTMPIEDLEKAWGLKIVAEKRRGENQLIYQLENNGALYIDVYRNIDANANEFTINIASAYYNMNYNLFPDGNFPKLIPEPLDLYEPLSFSVLHCSHTVTSQSELEQWPKLKKPSKYTFNHTYCWFSSNKKHVISITNNCDSSSVTITTVE